MKYYTHVHRSGNYLSVREVRDGKRRKFKVEYQPTLYLPATNKLQKNLKLTPDGKPVVAMKPGSMNDCYHFTKKNRGLQKVYGNTFYEYAFLNEEYPGHIEYNIADMIICNLDIEVASKGGFSTAEAADQEVTAITVKNSKDGIFHVFACKEFQNTLPEVRYYHCDNEEDLLERFLKLWEGIEPDIVTGWNVRLYDVPYLINRISRVLSPDAANRLSPWGEIKESNVNIFNKPHVVYDVAGINVLDYLLIYRKERPRATGKLPAGLHCPSGIG
jgi:DNA polymerase elongation subunit (family B)